MTVQTIYFGLVLTTFVGFMGVLGGVSLWSRLGR